MDWLATGFDAAQQWLFEAVVQPLLFAGGMANFLEDGYRATGWLLVGLLQLVVIVGLLVPLQRWRPVEAITDRSAVRTDIIYTLLQFNHYILCNVVILIQIIHSGRLTAHMHDDHRNIQFSRCFQSAWTG